MKTYLGPYRSLYNYEEYCDFLGPKRVRLALIEYLKQDAIDKGPLSATDFLVKLEKEAFEEMSKCVKGSSNEKS